MDEREKLDREIRDQVNRNMRWTLDPAIRRNPEVEPKEEAPRPPGLEDGDWPESWPSAER